ncbi:MAG TPA: MFS transporter, partial [Rheinheimera sp.]|nr:MFS transporter [Rheinheimera sp.]
MVFLLLVFKVSESPRWLLLHKRDEAAARAVFNQLQETDVDSIVADIKRTRPAEKKSGLFAKRYRFPVMLAFLLAFFNQLSGINFIIYFAPRIFSLAGLDSDSALLSSAGVGIINLIFTMLGLYLIDKAGRRLLMLIGSIGYIVSLSVVAYAFYAGIGGMAVVFFVFLFIASHAIGQGAVIWVFISEVFPNAVRAKGQSLGASTHWVFAALIALLMPFFLSVFSSAGIFSFFAFMMVLQLLFVLFVMPETKGRTLESISDEVQAVAPEAAVIAK